ncbi:MAG: urease accessory protein UreE [Alkalilacustris sp.]
MTGPLRIEALAGTAAELHDLLHAMEHRGQLETVRIARSDAARRRMRLTTDRGRDIALALPRSARLEDGAVLHLDDALAIVARVDGGPRLRLVPADAEAALRVGWHCGNLHWKVDFRDGGIEVHMDGPETTYRDRLRDLAGQARFEVTRLDTSDA